MKNLKGKFIVIEGMDGSGKSTIITMLKKYFEKLERNDVVFTREPGSTFSKEAEKIRKLILDNDNKFSHMTDALLFATSRRINLEKGIWPALQSSKTVISDRYWTSSFVYQGILGKVGLEQVIELNKIVTENTKPDFTIFFDLEPKLSVKRISEMRSSRDRLETTDVNYYVNLRKAYHEVIDRYPNEYKVIDANCSITELFEKVLDILKLAGIVSS